MTPGRPNTRRELSKALLNPVVVSGVVGALASIVIAIVQRPGTVQETKESISVITISDQKLLELSRSAIRVQTSRGTATGALLEQRYVVTSSALLARPDEDITLFRRFGEPDASTFQAKATLVDSTLGILVIDLGRADERAARLEVPATIDRKNFNRIFSLGFLGGKALTVREGRIVADRMNRPQDYGIPAGMAVPEGTIIADLDTPQGMAGAPVFLKDGTFMGLIYWAYPYGIAGVIPSTYVGDALLRVKGGER